MRIAALLVVLAGTAAADKRITDMTPGFEREAQTCAVQVSGLEKVQTGSQTLAPTLSPEDKAALDKDLETLAGGLAGVKAYCAEVTDLVTFLKASSAASYKSVEKQLDERDNKVRKLRKEAKKTIDTLQPITRRWIGRIAQAQAQKPDVVEKKTPGKFPSGRAVDLPPLGGTWKLSGNTTIDTAEYADKAWSATASVRSFTGATCEQQQKQQVTTGSPADGELPGAAALDIAWRGRTSADPSPRTYSEVLCARNKDGGGWMATLEVRPPTESKLTELRALLIRMVAARMPKSP